MLRMLAPLLFLVLVIASSAAAVPDLTDGYAGCSTSDDAFPFKLDSYTTGDVIDLLPEGNYPYDATMTPDGSQVWFVGASGDGVVVVDRASNTVVSRFAVADYAIGVAFTGDGSRAMVTSRGDEAVMIVDTATYAVLDTLPVPTGYLGAGNIALDPAGDRFFLVDWYDEILYEMAGDGSAITRQATVGSSLWQLVVSPDGAFVYVTDRGTEQVREIDTATLAETRAFDVGQDPWGLDITADGATLVVACEDSHEAALIDLASGTVTPVPLDATSDPRDVDILDEAGLAYVAGGVLVDGTDPIYVIDLETGAVVHTIDGPGSNVNVIAVQAQAHPGGVGVEEIPGAVAALTAYPNPFNPQVTIRLELPRTVAGTVTVCDLAGRTVRTLASGQLAAGVRTFAWDGRDAAGRSLPSGVYLVHVDAGGAEVSRKVVLTR